VTRNEIILTLAMLAICLSLFAWVITANAEPRPVPDPEWTAEARLALGVCIVAECEFKSESEAAAIGHILIRDYRKRWPRYQWSINEFIRRYCAVFDPAGTNYYRPRTRKIRESTFDKPLRDHPGEPEKWKRVKAFVDSFAAGEVIDPCPLCFIWYGNTDKKPATCNVVMGPPKYANHFCVKAQ